MFQKWVTQRLRWVGLACILFGVGSVAVAQEQKAAGVTGVSGGQIVGYIFGVPVPLENYYFAKTVSRIFAPLGEEGQSAAERERAIWEALILHYESFRRGVSVSEDELERAVDDLILSQKQSFKRKGDPSAYTRWVQETLNEDVALFENQMRYLLQIHNLKRQVRESFSVSVTEEELHQEFLDEQNHIGGEMVTFNLKEEAELFYQVMKDPQQWEQMKAQGAYPVRPVSLMTLEAYRDLWDIPRDSLYAFHAQPLGSIGAPMPFGKQWCVYRLLDKRTGDLKDFPAQRGAYVKQVTAKKQYEALKHWVEDLKQQAHLQVLPIVVEKPEVRGQKSEVR